MSERVEARAAGESTLGIRAREALLGYAYLVPAFVVFAIFFFYPLAKLIQLSLYDTRGVFANQRQEFVGLSQWTDVLGGEEFRSSLWITIQYVLYTVPAGIILGVLLAQLAHRKMKGIKFFQTVFASTVASSVAVASVIFFALVNPRVRLLPQRVVAVVAQHRRTRTPRCWRCRSAPSGRTWA